MFLDNVSLVSDSWKRVWASCSCGRLVAQTGAYERCRLRSSPRFLRTASRRMSPQDGPTLRNKQESHGLWPGVYEKVANPLPSELAQDCFAFGAGPVADFFGSKANSGQDPNSGL